MDGCRGPPVLRQLETLGYLERHDDPDDQRGRRIRLTSRGHAAVTTIRGAVTHVEREWAQKIGERDIETLREILTRLAAVLDGNTCVRADDSAEREPRAV